MKGALWFTLGVVAGAAAIAMIKPASTSSCCTRVACGARNTIGEKAGIFGGAVKGFLDMFGFTQQLPSVIDAVGVSNDC